MKRHKIHAVLAGCIMAAIASVSASGQTISQLCTPKITANEVVASPKQRYDAGQKAQPPVTDNNAFFAWPDTPMGVIKTGRWLRIFWQRWRVSCAADVGRSLGGQQ